MHSRYAVRYSHAIFATARVATQLMKLRYDEKIEVAKYRARHGDDFKTKYALDDVITQDKRIKKIRDGVIELEVQKEILESVATGFDVIRQAASREMYRRSNEHAPKD